MAGDDRPRGPGLAPELVQGHPRRPVAAPARGRLLRQPSPAGCGGLRAGGPLPLGHREPRPPRPRPRPARGRQPDPAPARRLRPVALVRAQHPARGRGRQRERGRLRQRPQPRPAPGLRSPQITELNSPGVDASTMEANAALRAIVRRADGEGYREMLERLAGGSGIGAPGAGDLARLARRRKGKRLANAEWASPTDPEARIAKLKDGCPRLAYKPEHAVDLDTGAIVAAEVHPADRGDTATLPGTLAAAEANLAAVGATPTPEDPAELVADKGYHSRDGLKELEDGAWRSRIAEKKTAGVSRWRGDEAARRAVYNNRARLRSGVAREAFRLRAELVERSFALVLDRGGMRRAWLRGRDNLKKRYLVHVAGYNLGLIMRLLVGAGTPREFLAGASARMLALTTADDAVLIVLTVAAGTETAMLVVSVQPGPRDGSRVSSTRC